VARLVVLVVAYLIGSFNFSIVALRLAGRPDPRTVHSGNAGAANVARTAGLGVAAIVLALDLARAVVVARAALRLCSPEIFPWSGFALVLGNRYPLWHRLRGGKGVASYLGFVGATEPWGALVSCAGWVITYGATRIAAVASMAMLVGLSVTMVLAMPRTMSAFAATALSVLLIVAGHAPNWRALRNDTRTPETPG
jgi:acyl phosphate:glycerol-3-phosphate acyltransferase